MKVIFVGCNPTSRNHDPKVPFKGTRSWNILEKWMRALDLSEDDVRFINLTDKVTKTQSNIKKSDINLDRFAINLLFETFKSVFGDEDGIHKTFAFVQKQGKLDPKNFVLLTNEELEKHLSDPRWDQGSPKLIALGKMAAWGLKKVGVPYFELPHPSGLNRKLNDPEFVDKVLKSCKGYLEK